VSDANENLLLAQMRTIFALERNYLADKRTSLAELRAGIALLIFATPSTLIIPSSELPSLSLFATVGLYIFLGGLFFLGFRWIINAQRKLTRIKKKLAEIKNQEIFLMESSPALKKLLGDLI
jgi:uncharacterized membrane protein YidH (DUF202 family)